MYKLALVGRPNVGKSALFNAICKKRIAIVDEAEGTTRDRLYAEVTQGEFAFTLIDTGGINPGARDSFAEGIREQAQSAIQEADSLVLVVDGRLGPQDLDFRLARLLLTTQKPLTLAINKIDEPSQQMNIHNFYGLGVTKMLPVSAAHGFQIAELIEKAWEGFQFKGESGAKEEAIKVAIVGRTNVGKSTLINQLIEENRCLVSPVAGTTRDSIDIPFTFEGHSFVLIDTAGIRRKKSEREVVEKFAALRTARAISRSDVCLLLVDALEGLTAQEKRIAKEIEAAGKGCLVVMNKWDLVSGFRMEHAMRVLKEESPFLAHCPLLLISALTGRNVDKLLTQARLVYESGGARIPTHELNKAIEKAMQLNHPPMLQGKRLRIYYATQVETHPPRILLFVNRANLLPLTYRHYLYNFLRKQFAFPGNPLLLEVRAKAAHAIDYTG
jgi:GTPase